MVAEANRIFGFEGWDRETVASDCVWTKQQGSRYCAAYVARVRITVRAGETRIIREGCGVGESSALSPGQAHDFAAKAAETDATKRALMTFGNAFGLSLYSGTGAAPCPACASGAGAWRRIPSKHSRKQQSQRHQAAKEDRPDLSSKGPSTTSVGARSCPRRRYLPRRPRRARLPAHRQECSRPGRATARPRPRAPALCGKPALPGLREVTIRSPSPPLCAAPRHEPEGLG